MSASIPISTSIGAMPMVPTEPIWKLSVDQYHEMVRTGILTDDDPVELLEGWLVTKMPKNPAHRACTRLVQQALEQVGLAGWYVDSQEPITLDASEPEPDAMLVRGETRMYLDRHPGPSDIALVVEIADSSLDRDRVVKQRIYARAGIPTYWIINLSTRTIEVYRHPQVGDPKPAYSDRQDYSETEQVPVIIDQREFARLDVRSLLP